MASPLITTPSNTESAQVFQFGNVDADENNNNNNNNNDNNDNNLGDIQNTLLQKRSFNQVSQHDSQRLDQRETTQEQISGENLFSSLL